MGGGRVIIMGNRLGFGIGFLELVMRGLRVLRRMSIIAIASRCLFCDDYPMKEESSGGMAI
jgi:5-formyltetrahydrofolate cyclo-ligase